MLLFSALWVCALSGIVIFSVLLMGFTILEAWTWSLGLMVWKEVSRLSLIMKGMILLSQLRISGDKDERNLLHGIRSVDHHY